MRTNTRSLLFPVGSIVLWLVSAIWIGVGAQAPQPVTPNQWGYAYPDAYDAVVAAPEVHRLKYEDAHVQFLEVANPPGYKMRMHGHPHPSVFARVSNNPPPLPGTPPPPPGSQFLDPKSLLNGQNWREGPAPEGMEFPTCTAADSQAPHLPQNYGSFPFHFVRIEFKRVDQDGFSTRWKEWYPWMVEPVKPVKDLPPDTARAPDFSREWPYPIAYDSVNAAPNNYQLRFENDDFRLVEVTIRPGERENMNGHPYASVLAFDTVAGFDAVTANVGVTDSKLQPASTLKSQNAGQSPPPAGMTMPRCVTMRPQAPHAVRNDSTVPLHYYRMEFKRIDGKQIETEWKKWYPWMLEMR